MLTIWMFLFSYMFGSLDERIVSKKRPIGPGSDVVTKHDAIVCGRKNTKNVENVGCYIPITA